MAKDRGGPAQCRPVARVQHQRLYPKPPLSSSLPFLPSPEKRGTVFLFLLPQKASDLSLAFIKTAKTVGRKIHSTYDKFLKALVDANRTFAEMRRLKGAKWSPESNFYFSEEKVQLESLIFPLKIMYFPHIALNFANFSHFALVRAPLMCSTRQNAGVLCRTSWQVSLLIPIIWTHAPKIFYFVAE